MNVLELDDALRGKRIAIFGAGYIGSALIKELLRYDVEIYAVTRNAEALSQWDVCPKVYAVESDVHTGQWKSFFPDSFDFVLNCLGAASRDIEGYRTSYIEGQRCILDWLKDRWVKRYIYTGSTSVYSQANGQWVKEEDADPGEAEAAKILWEAEQMVLNSKMPVNQRIILRLGAIYGPGRHHLLDMVRKGLRVMPGLGDSYLNVSYCDDVVRAIIHSFVLPDLEDGAIYNICDGHPYKKKEIVKWLASIMQQPMPMFDASIEASRMPMRNDGKVENRRISSEKFKQDFKLSLVANTYKEGYDKIFYEE